MPGPVTLAESAFRSYAVHRVYFNWQAQLRLITQGTPFQTLYDRCIAQAADALTPLVLEVLGEHDSTKVYMSLTLTTLTDDADSEEMANSSESLPPSNIGYTTRAHVVNQPSDLEPILEDMVERVFQAENPSLNRGVEAGVAEVSFHIAGYNPITGSSYVRLPKGLANKKACVNVKNDDDKCFLWASLSALHPATNHAERASNYSPYLSEINFGDLQGQSEILGSHRAHEKSLLS